MDIDQLILGGGLILFGFIALQLVLGQIKAGNVPQIRRLAGIDGIDEAIGRCAEMGKGVALNAMGNITGSRSADPIAGLAIIGYATRVCARMGARPFYPIAKGISIPLMLNILETNYAAEGKAEVADREWIMPIGSSTSEAGNANQLAGLFARQNVGAVIFMGNQGINAPVLADAGGETGISIIGTSYQTNIPIIALLTDYCFIGEELYAASCYISKDPLMSASLRVQDFLKFWVIGGTALFAVLMAAGITW